MDKKAALSALFTSAFLISIVAGLQVVEVAEANFTPAPLPHTYVQSDGTINPSTAPISRNGNIYTLTGDLKGTVLDIRLSNAIVDGRGFNIPGSGYDKAILLNSVTNVTVKNFNISGRSIDIHLNASSYCTITGNRMSGAGSYGIWLSDRSDGNVISENFVEDCYYGIYFGYSRNNVLRNNSVVGYKHTPPFGQNFAVVGDVLEDFINDVDTSNILNGKTVYYWVNRKNAEVPPNAGWIALVNSTNITVQNQNLNQNKYGVLLAWVSESTLRNNSLEYNAVGIYLFHSLNNTIANNNVSNSHGIDDNESHGIRVQSSYNNVISGNNAIFNHGAGICLSQSPGTRLMGNSVTQNFRTGVTIINHSTQSVVFCNYISNNSGVALRIADSPGSAVVANNITKNRYYAVYLTGLLQGTRIYGNIFADNRVSNTLQAFVDASDANPEWDNGTIGNYWGDYLTLYPNASEIESSGIGDIPYIIVYNNVDHYPVMTPLDASTICIPDVEVPPMPDPTPTPTPSPTPTSSPSISPTLNPTNAPRTSSSLSPEPTFSTSPTSTAQQPAPTSSLTADYFRAEDYTPAILVCSVIAVAVAVGLLIYFKKGRRCS